MSDRGADRSPQRRETLCWSAAVQPADGQRPPPWPGELVEAAFHDVAPLVELCVEGRRAPAVAASAEAVADLVGPFGDGVTDAPPSQPGADRSGAVALVAQDMGGPQAGTPRAGAGHPDRFQYGGELGAVVGVPAREHEGQGSASGVAGQVDLACQAASGASESGNVEPPCPPTPGAAAAGCTRPPAGRTGPARGSRRCRRRCGSRRCRRRARGG